MPSISSGDSRISRRATFAETIIVSLFASCAESGDLGIGTKVARKGAVRELIPWPVALNHVFRAIVFDWDGTAVEDRESSTDPLVRALIRAMEQCLKDGILLVVITGTRIEHLERQALRFLSPQAKENLFVCANRGSEVFGYSLTGERESIFKRTASPAEDAALDRAGEGFQEYLRKTYGLETGLIRDRLNRRKIDLLPVTEWANPRKSEFPRLLSAVQERLNGARVLGGLKALIKKAVLSGNEAGLGDPKVTSDLKHIEIGLTDKSNSVAWVEENLLDRYAIPLHEVAFVGDEFGEVGGLPGSDSLMRSSIRAPGDEQPVFVSVGSEPLGAVPGVHVLCGGPARFVEFLEHQNRLRKALAAEIPPLWKKHDPTPDTVWCVEQEGFDPTRERELESIFTIGNGYLGVRGSLDTPIPSSQADLFIAGIYDRKILRYPYSDLGVLTPQRGTYPFTELVSFPTPFTFRLWLDGQPLTLVDEKWTSHTRFLDMKKGMFFEQFRYSDARGRITTVNSFRCASMTDEHLLLQGLEIVTEIEEGSLEIETPLGSESLESLYPHLTLINEGQKEGDFAFTHYKTQASGFEVGIAARCSQDGKDIPSRRWRTPISSRRPLRIRRFITVHASRDSGNVRASAESHLRLLRWTHFDRIIASHESRWNELWATADIAFEGSPSSTETQRFNSYHLLIAAPRAPDVSVGARTLSGRGYEGHVFWDAEIFMLPFYLNAVPEAARNILLYRFHTLPEAKKRARKMGCEGACFAWESTVTGEDVTPDRIILVASQREVPIATGKQQIHVTADVAYGICRYWHATHDEKFMLECGVELLIETARFWATRCRWRKEAFHVLDVIGPDEYHRGVNDNAFTNWMAQFNLEKAFEVTVWMQGKHPEKWREIVSKLSISAKEATEWKRIAEAMYLPMPNHAGIIEQFEGFFDLAEHPADRMEQLRAPIGRLFEWEKINGVRLIKQADVLMLPFLFRDRFSVPELIANFKYYEPITDHGSSLSPSVHATIAAWIGDRECFERFYNQGAELDLFNLMKNSALGVHAANMGGIWQALVYGVLGVRFENSGISVDPAAPSRMCEEWSAIRMNLSNGGKSNPITVRRGKGDAP